MSCNLTPILVRSWHACFWKESSGFAFRWERQFYKDTHIPMQTGAVVNVTLQGCTDFWKSSRHLKILGAGQVTWDKFRTVDSQILGTIVQNVVAMVWRPEFVHPSLVSQPGGRLPDKPLLELTGCNFKIKSSATCLRIASSVHLIHNHISASTVNCS